MLESGKERVLIIAPHADDEVLGCGGLIEKACRLGNDVKVVIGSVGDTFFWHANAVISAETRLKELADAMHHLGCTDVEVMYEDRESWMDTIPQRELITKVDRLLSGFQPSMVFIPYPSFHQDHQALFLACMAGLRPHPKRNYKLVAMYEYPFIVWQYPRIKDAGDLYLDISDTVDKKLEALRHHASQLLGRDSNHMISPETVSLWAKTRGMEIGVAYAEKYYILRSSML